MAHPQPVLPNFHNFHESWLSTQQSFLQQLLDSAALQSNDKEDAQLRLIAQVLAHYQQYYDELSKAAAEDIFQVLSAPWLTSFERTFLWISGFKPSLLIRLLFAAVNDLTPAQSARLNEVRAEVKWNERELTDAMASLQETIAAPPMLELARRVGAGRLVDGEICEMESAIEELKMGMLRVADRADLLRGSTGMTVVEILNSDQMVRVLAAVVGFQLRIRRWGLQRD